MISKNRRFDRRPPLLRACTALLRPAAAGILLLLVGCDPTARHVALSTLFDGVPTLPPVEQICQEQLAKAQNAEQQKDTNTKSATASEHRPYAEKACNNCHDKEKEDGLIKPKRELCTVCHTDLIKGPLVHGPVAVGDCLACHLPHTASFPSLLKKESKAVCGNCHLENRVAGGMHTRVSEKSVGCTECHDPHSGSVHFFLK